MVKELSDKHLAAINRGRKAAGLKPIRRKKKAAKSKDVSRIHKDKFAEWQKKRPKKEKIAMKKYEEKEQKFHIKTIKKYRKYRGDLKPPNTAYVYMVDSKDNLRAVLKSEVKKYNLE